MIVYSVGSLNVAFISILRWRCLKLATTYFLEEFEARFRFFFEKITSNHFNDAVPFVYVVFITRYC